ncbi:class I adenylate-forming enzyme family protein [Natrinema soli]|jgi:acyl-CoA synthetase (AMP-forming)/AMP-acid ligase II|uniref:Class I adenylate-forming enzyme family protein n=1 Tax=Natrinema soli TaxID=1930624 RepID=A0ABD5SSQ1_9EURY|nr:class I adenylate-forming enzyme family protein [Natrinema soli]
MKVHSQSQIDRYEQAGVWGETTLLDRFSDTVESAPDRKAVVDPPNAAELVDRDPEQFTYEAFAERVGGIAAGLRDHGVEKNDVVVVQLPNTWELAALYLAVARAGGVISPLPVQWRRRELDHVVELTDAELFVTLDEFNGFDHVEMARDAVTDLDSLEEIVTLTEIREMSEQEPDPSALDDVSIGANEVFNLEWTSGTTAAPKACPMTHNNWHGMPILPLLDFEIGEPQTVLCTAPLVNMTAVGVNLIPWLLTGGTFVIHHPLDFDILVDQIQTEGVTFTILVPTVMNRLLKHPGVDDFDLSGVDTIATGSAAPAEWALEEFRDRWGIEVVNIWGQNEGTAIISGPKTTPMARRATDFPQFGADRDDTDWAFSDPRVDTIRTKIVDDTGDIVTETGEVGELAYKGPGVIAEYFRQPDLTDDAFDDEGYFYTGDLFQIEDDGFISFFDRKKDVIIRGGYTISAKEVENVVLEHPDVADAAVVGMPDEDLGERVCLYAVPVKGSDLSLKDITNTLEDDLAIYKHPERLEVVETIPRNPVGKIRKTELREDIAETADTATNGGEV